MTVLEVQVVDQDDRERRHQWTEIPETSSVSLVVDVAAEDAQDQEERREDGLERLLLQVGVAQPLPLEVQPPHPDLRGDRCLAFGNRRLAVLLAVEVVLEGFPGLRAERATPRELRAA